jgi:hypothetical protein
MIEALCLHTALLVNDKALFSVKPHLRSAGAEIQKRIFIAYTRCRNVRFLPGGAKKNQK